MKSLYLFLFFFSFYSTSSFSQNEPPINPCGTPAEKVPWLLKYQQNPQQFQKSLDDLIYVPITVHIVGTYGGAGFFGQLQTLNALCTLNADFEASNIQFYLEGSVFNYVFNNNWFEHDSSDGYDMMMSNNVPDAINCYIVEDPAGNCGYSYYDAGIALSKSCITPAQHTWAHELGHSLSLPHPFYGWEYHYEYHDFSKPAPQNVSGTVVEKMDGSNCEYAADGFCDTKPDYLSDRWTCNDTSFSITPQLDPDSISFRSDGSLFMSYSRSECASQFSKDQIAAMRANLYDDRPNLLFNQPSIPPIGKDFSFIPVHPAIGEKISPTNVYLEWEEVENATHYILQISPMPNFSYVDQFLVEGNSFNPDNDLLAGRKLFWRIRPFSTHYFCTDFSSFQYFETDELTAAHTIDFSKNTRIYPSLLKGNEALNLESNLLSGSLLDISIYSISGNLIHSEKKMGKTGKNSFQLLIPNLKSGTFFIEIMGETERSIEKIVVNN